MNAILTNTPPAMGFSGPSVCIHNFFQLPGLSVQLSQLLQSPCPQHISAPLTQGHARGHA